MRSGVLNSYSGKMLSFFILIVFIGLNSFAQQDTIYLWPGKVPDETEAKHDPVPTPDTSRGVIRITNITNPAMIVYEPEKLTDNGNSVVICPGGAYKYLAINIEGFEVAKWLNSLGFTAYVLQYRVPDKREEALADIQRAIRIVRQRSDGKNTKIGVIGFSAGGSLCAHAAIRFDEETYSKTDEIDSLSCRPDFAMLIYPAYLDEGENRTLTPSLKIRDNTPPVFVFGTADDAYSNSALVMTAALRDNKIPVELHILPQGGHGYGLRSGNIAAETWPQLTEIWLKKMITIE
jgi:acetyl esterase/lipase